MIKSLITYLNTTNRNYVLTNGVLLFCVFLSNSCMSKNYQYYIEEGDRILNECYTDVVNVQYESDEICVIKETIEGESGDFLNVYIQYYDSNRKLVAYKRISNFFNSICYEGILREESLYSINNQILKKEKHIIYKEDGSILNDTLDCVFNYRNNYKVLFEYPSR